jgi:hypothetical protein
MGALKAGRKWEPRLTCSAVFVCIVRALIMAMALAHLLIGGLSLTSHARGRSMLQALLRPFAGTKYAVGMRYVTGVKSENSMSAQRATIRMIHLKNTCYDLAAIATSDFKLGLVEKGVAATVQAFRAFRSEFVTRR